MIIIKKPLKKMRGFCTPGRIRTLSLLVRSQTIYPVDLRALYRVVARTGVEPVLPTWEAGVLTTRLTRQIIKTIMAGLQGVEPQLYEPESYVLPLDDNPFSKSH